MEHYDFTIQHRTIETRSHEYFQKVLDEYVTDGWIILRCGAVHEEGCRELKWWAILQKMEKDMEHADRTD